MWTQNVLKGTDSETKEVYLTKNGGWKLKNDTENKIEITDSSPAVKREAISKIAKKIPIKESNSTEDDEIICLDSDSEKEEDKAVRSSQNENSTENNEHEETASDKEFNSMFEEYLNDDEATAERQRTSNILSELYLDKNDQSELTPSRKRKIDQVDKTGESIPRSTPPRSLFPPVESSDDDIICLDSD